ncbi:MAG: hypothetical protein AAF539_06960 [Planctomycetota bacterium]
MNADDVELLSPHTNRNNSLLSMHPNITAMSWLSQSETADASDLTLGTIDVEQIASTPEDATPAVTPEFDFGDNLRRPIRLGTGNLKLFD